MSNPVQEPSRFTKLAAVLTVVVSLLGILTGWITYRTAVISQDTERMKNQQAQTEERVQQNEARTERLQEQVNDLESPADRQRAAKLLSGTWQGEYRCSQGLTGMKLIIYVADESTLLVAFHFFPLKSNPDVPEGTFAMKGTYSVSDFDLKGDYWVEKPETWGMVDIAGKVPTGASEKLSGSLTGACRTYELEKTSTTTSKPPV
jgi:hypothetical protein